MNEIVSFADYAYGIQLLGFLQIGRKKDNHITICQNNVILKLFRRRLVSHVKFSYLLKVSRQYHYWFRRCDNFLL